MHNTAQALALLRKFETVLQREALKNDLDSKHAVIFHKFGQVLGVPGIQTLNPKP